MNEQELQALLTDVVARLAEVDAGAIGRDLAIKQLVEGSQLAFTTFIQAASQQFEQLKSENAQLRVELEAAKRTLTEAGRELSLDLARANLRLASLGERQQLDATANEARFARLESEANARIGNVEDFVGAVRLKSGRLVRAASGVVDGQLYADGVADVARVRAAKILEEDFVAVLEAIDGGSSYDDIRARLLEAYTAMSPDNLAKLTESAIKMGELAGRLAVNEDA